MNGELDRIECRVLAVLIEKSLTQPASYPLTVNAIVQAANQKQNRDPIMALEDDEVKGALTHLQSMNLVQQAPPLPGARAQRFSHNVVEKLTWDRREQAIMAELMLRGRQTPGELRTRASRMAPLTDVPAVLNVLQELAAYSPPYVKELGREPGRTVTRYEQLLHVDGEEPSLDESPIADSGMSLDAAPAAVDERSLRQRVELLESRVAILEKILEAYQNK
ncbi:MAG: DUF480 domain-containing protein [Phycisphaerae bacterium]